MLGLVDAITGFDPTWTDEKVDGLWGPWLTDGIYGQLWVARPATAVRWAIELRPEASEEDAWVPGDRGPRRAGGDETHCVGWFVLDFTATDAVGAGDDELGGLGVQYELLEDGAIATVAFGDISDDGALPTDGAYHYDHTVGKAG